MFHLNKVWEKLECLSTHKSEQYSSACIPILTDHKHSSGKFIMRWNSPGAGLLYTLVCNWTERRNASITFSSKFKAVCYPPRLLQVDLFWINLEIPSMIKFPLYSLFYHFRGYKVCCCCFFYIIHRHRSRIRNERTVFMNSAVQKSYMRKDVDPELRLSVLYLWILQYKNHAC